MKNIIIICEGQSEQIFIRNLIERKMNPSKISFRCLKLQGQKEEQVPYKYELDDAKLNIIILNAQNDERVLAVIKDRYNSLDRKYDIIIGLRDMYSKHYPDTKVNEIENQLIKKNIKKQIRKFDTNKKVRFFFMIMEFESWLMNLKKTLEEYVFDKTGEIPLISSEPEKYFRPSQVLKSILSKHGIKYDKHFSETESILSYFQADDIEFVLHQKSYASFQLFLRYCLKYREVFI
jgi:hypothetical protein